MIEQKLFALGNACMEHNQTGLIFVWISRDTLHACYLQRPYIQIYNMYIHTHTYTDQVRYVYISCTNINRATKLMCGNILHMYMLLSDNFLINLMGIYFVILIKFFKTKLITLI